VNRPPGRRPGLFISGTDTGVGKTTVACAFLRLAKTRGHRLVPFKPAETGCSPDPEDAFRLWDAAETAVARDAICLYPLPLPAAPQAAAAHAGVAISLEAILQRADDLGQNGDGIVAEGAGGLLVPYAPGVTGVDLARALGLPILLVARTALGTINHTALSIFEMRRQGLPLAGVLLVDTVSSRQPHQDSNVALIEELTGVRPLGTFPYIKTTAPDHLAHALANALTPPALQRLLDTASGRLSATSDG
jgi:dethiobiotin synthetase